MCKCWDYRETAVSVTRRIFWTGQLPPSSQDMAQDKNYGQNFTTDLKHYCSVQPLLHEFVKPKQNTINTITGERLKLFDLVVAVFKFYTMRVFLCVLQLQFYTKKTTTNYTLKNH